VQLARGVDFTGFSTPLPVENVENRTHFSLILRACSCAEGGFQHFQQPFLWKTVNLPELCNLHDFSA
jgi:hypothetical protein